MLNHFPIQQVLSMTRDKPAVLTFTTSGSYGDSITPYVVVDPGTTVLWEFSNTVTSTSATPPTQAGLGTDENTHTLTVNPSRGLKEFWADECGLSSVTNMESFRNFEVWHTARNACAGNPFSVSRLRKLRVFFVEQGSMQYMYLSDLTELYQVHCASNDFRILDLSGCDCWHVCSHTNHYLREMDLSGMTRLQELFMHTVNVSVLDISDSPLLDYAYIHSAPYYVLDTANKPNMATLWSYDTFVQSYDLSGDTSLTDILLHTNDLNQSAVDSIISDVVTIGLSNGTLDLHNNAIPSATGLADVVTLESRGWTVTVEDDWDSNTFYFVTKLPEIDPSITVTGTPNVLWTFSDDSTSTAYSATASSLADYGRQKLTCDDWSAITEIDIQGDRVIRLDNLHLLTNLTTLQLSACYMKRVDLTGLTNLTDLLLYNNKMFEIDISPCPNLTSIYLGGSNRLPSTNVESILQTMHSWGDRGYSGTCYMNGENAPHSGSAEILSIISDLESWGWTLGLN